MATFQEDIGRVSNRVGILNPVQDNTTADAINATNNIFKVGVALKQEADREEVVSEFADQLQSVTEGAVTASEGVAGNVEALRAAQLEHRTLRGPLINVPSPEEQKNIDAARLKVQEIQSSLEQGVMKESQAKLEIARMTNDLARVDPQLLSQLAPHITSSSALITNAFNANANQYKASTSLAGGGLGGTPGLPKDVQDNIPIYGERVAIDMYVAAEERARKRDIYQTQLINGNAAQGAWESIQQDGVIGAIASASDVFRRGVREQGPLYNPDGDVRALQLAFERQVRKDAAEAAAKIPGFSLSRVDSIITAAREQIAQQAAIAMDPKAQERVDQLTKSVGINSASDLIKLSGNKALVQAFAMNPEEFAKNLWTMLPVYESMMTTGNNLLSVLGQDRLDRLSTAEQAALVAIEQLMTKPAVVAALGMEAINRGAPPGSAKDDPFVNISAGGALRALQNAEIHTPEMRGKAAGYLVLAESRHAITKPAFKAAYGQYPEVKRDVDNSIITRQAKYARDMATSNISGIEMTGGELIVTYNELSPAGTTLPRLQQRDEIAGGFTSKQLTEGVTFLHKLIDTLQGPDKAQDYLDDLNEAIVRANRTDAVQLTVDELLSGG